MPLHGCSLPLQNAPTAHARHIANAAEPIVRKKVSHSSHVCAGFVGCTVGRGANLGLVEYVVERGDALVIAAAMLVVVLGSEEKIGIVGEVDVLEGDGRNTINGREVVEVMVVESMGWEGEVLTP
ncbi:hypothetical protein K440DRAFT_641115 [Wilcoxina mikolae CBS 423.85]|nr:hypothetical protein K440DRAFT_641115 [Wilcoxina mikolae CBS 423.85]